LPQAFILANHLLNSRQEAAHSPAGMMAERAWEDSGTGNVEWVHHGLRDAFSGASVLLVEDDPDITEMLTTLLDLAGFTPTACSSAEAALEQLRESSFDLVLTDYMLPRRTGGWLLEQASAEGLIDGTAVLVVTAHPHPPDVRGYEIISKPFDLDHLVVKIQQHLEGPTRRPKMPFSATLNGDGVGDGMGANDSPRVELILYVSKTARCEQAIQTIQQVVRRFSPGRVNLTIHDLSADPNHGLEDSVAYTPTLVRRLPRPRTFLMGDITNPEVVVELLQGVGEEN
jgi:DNA-binding response OmpR family regulator